MEHNAFTFRNKVEVMCEVSRILDHRMVWMGDRLILQAVSVDHLLSSLNTHLHHWDEHIATGDLLHFRLAYHKPLPGAPPIVAINL
jgi:hypothetical protein